MKFNRNFWKNKKVFITGHTGFKGSWLILVLSIFGSKIYGYSLKPLKRSLFKKANLNKLLISNIYADIRNIHLLKKQLRKTKPQIVFHFAAQSLVFESFINPKTTFETNVLGTVNLLETIRGINSIKSVVIITTDKVYKIKKINNKYKEIDELGGNDPYSASKASCELVVNAYLKSYFGKKKNIYISTARSGNVIGGGDYSNNRLIPDIIKSINLNKQLTIRNPNSVRPW